MRKQLGDVVRDARQTADMTQEELAAAAGVSRAMLQNLERGRTAPRRAQIRRIAAALGTNVPALMERLEDVSTPVSQEDELARLQAEIAELREEIKRLSARKRRKASENDTPDLADTDG